MTTFTLQWPQIIWIVMAVMNFTTYVINHGKPVKTKNHNMWVALVSTVLAFSLLWWGGFFSPVPAQALAPLPTVCHDR